MKPTNDIFGRLGDILRPVDPLTLRTVLPGERDVPFGEKVERIRRTHSNECVIPRALFTTKWSYSFDPSIVRVCHTCTTRTLANEKVCMGCGRTFEVGDE